MNLKLMQLLFDVAPFMPMAISENWNKEQETCLVLLIHTAVIIIFLSENSPQIP